MPPDGTGDVSALLRAWAGGDPAARDRLASLVYADLRRVARARLRGNVSATLTPSDVVQEAYMRLLRQEARWANRIHFFGVAAEMMRRVLVDHARARAAEKRGGGHLKVDLGDAAEPAARKPVDVVDLDCALSELAGLDAEQAHIVELYFFGGLTFDEIAELVGTSASSVKRACTSALLWLHRRMRGDAPRAPAR